MRLSFVLLFAAQIAAADPVTDIADAAQAAFAKMPDIRRVGQIAGACGADGTVHTAVVYCTTRNQIFVADEFWDSPQTPYLVAHAYGHAVQVQHGVADFALGQIRTRRSEEVMLRGLVERQVDCIAGFLVSRANGSDAALTTLFSRDPLDNAHWGRDPLRLGPRVGVEMAARADWYATGLAGNLAACGPGEFTADLLLDALRP